MTHLKLEGVHLCCGGCVDAVATALESVPGTTFACDMENGTVTFTARDDATAQKALDAIAAAGLHGDTGNERLRMKAEPNIAAGKVQRARVSGIHNCCQPCYEAIEGAIRSVEASRATRPSRAKRLSRSPAISRRPSWFGRSTLPAFMPR